MSVFAEFEVPTDQFALEDILNDLPEVEIEIERVVASEDVLTPYFWVSNASPEEFETAAERDASVRDLIRVDTFDEAALYRAEWTKNVESIVFVYTQIGEVILDATYQGDIWQLEMRFDSREDLQTFQSWCEENEMTYTVTRLHELTQAHSGSQYGLTPKQREALVAVWQAGYYESPAETSLQAVADDLGISQQALSQRLRNGIDLLIANTLTTSSPS